MEYIYAAMLLHKAGKEVTEANVKKVLEAAGVKADTARIKALTVALEGVNIDDVVKNAPVATAAPAAASATEASEATEEKKEENKEDDKKTDEEAAAGMGALFG